MKLALALALVLAPVAPSSAQCTFFRAVVEGGRTKDLSLLDRGCQERPSTIGFNPTVRSASRRYVPCSVEGAPIMVQHFAQPGCVGEVIKTSQESPGICTAKISQVYQVENDRDENHCAAFFPDTKKSPLNTATIFPKVDYFAPGQCRTLTTIGLGGVSSASSGMYACNADGSMTFSKFASEDCTGNSIPTTFPKSPASRCSNDVRPASVEAALIGKGACVPVCGAAPGLPTPQPTPGTLIPQPSIGIRPPTPQPTRGTVIPRPTRGTVIPPPTASTGTSTGVFVGCERLSVGCNVFSLAGGKITPVGPVKTCGTQSFEFKCECYKAGSASQPKCTQASGSRDGTAGDSVNPESETRSNQPVLVGAVAACIVAPVVALSVYRRRRAASADAVPAAKHTLRPYSDDDL